MAKVISLFGNNKDDDSSDKQETQPSQTWEDVLGALSNPKSAVHRAIDDDGHITPAE